MINQTQTSAVACNTLVAQSLTSALCQRRDLSVASCLSIVAISCVTAGQPGKGKRRVWMIARQHPGESMAEWFIEGICLF